jgi:hypothetical protein
MIVRGPALALLGLLLSCSQEPLSARIERIIDGELSTEDEDGVVLLRAEVSDSEVLCSGSLIAPNLVVTARHCVSYLSPGLFNCTVQGELIDNPDGGGSLGQHFPAESIGIWGNALPRKQPLAHGREVISTLTPSICVNDVAFVVLDTALDLPIVPLRLGRPAEMHEPVTLLGFGLTADRQGIDYESQPRRRKTGLEIAGVGPDSREDGVTVVPPRALILKGPSGCVGDSGGPLLSAHSGALLGVYSLQAGESCTLPDVRHQLTHLPPFRALLDEAFEAAGATPIAEPEPEGEGGGGSGGGDGSEAVELAGAGGNPAETPQPGHDRGDDSGCSISAAVSITPSWSWLGLAALLLARRRAQR